MITRYLDPSGGVWGLASRASGLPGFQRTYPLFRDLYQELI